MATGAAIGSAVIGGIGAVKSRKASKKQAKEQEKIDLENIEREKEETEESIRRAEEANKANLGMARTQIGASGFGSGSSMDSYLASIKKQQESDIDWMRTSGASRAEISARESAARKRAADRYAQADFIGSIGRSLNTLSSFNW